MDGGSFIRELCIALNHRWEPERPFLLFTTYFDESDTHGPNPNVVMAALLSSARDWELFDRRIKALQRRDKFSVFHAKDFRGLRGEFKGWGPEKCARLVNDLAVAVRDHVKEAVYAVLPRQLYMQEYRSLPFPKGMPIDSQYGVCFRACLYRLMQILSGDKKKHKLHVIIEDGHKNIGGAVRIFNEMKDEYAALGFPMLGTITPMRKSESRLLMVADFQAHMGYLSETRLLRGQPDYFQMAGIREPKRNEAALTRLEITAESLHATKASWEADKQARIEKWRATRAAKRAVSSQASSEGQPS